MFIPTTREEMDRLGWDRADILLVSGDTYTDNSYNGTALVACLLPLHVVEILALAYLILNVVLLAKKDKRLAFLQYLVAVLILLLAIACYLESYLIS